MKHFKRIGLLSVLLAFLMPYSAFAEVISSEEPFDYNNGLLDNQKIVESNSFHVNSYDNNITSEEKIWNEGNREITFKYPVDIESFYIKWRETSLNVNLSFYANDELAYTTTGSPNGYKDLFLEGITRISVKVDNKYYGFLSEMDFFGTYDIENIGPDLDGDGIPDSEDDFPDDPTNGDSDGDGIPDSEDEFPDDPLNGEEDSDGDGIPDSEDDFPDDPSNTPDEIAPMNVSNIDYNVSDTTINFTYDLPLDDDFSHLIISRDGASISENYSLSSFNDGGLSADTHYVYTFKSVDNSGNVSSGEVIGVTTNVENDTTAPFEPSGLDVINGNNSIMVTWNPNIESDLAGYNVYIDGVRHNASLIVGNTYSVYNLVNEDSYDISVSAVDTNGNESVLSSVVTATPSVDNMPIFSLTTDLTDIADSTENWFSELWLVLAFATAIPLSFYIANRIKTLFLA